MAGKRRPRVSAREAQLLALMRRRRSIPREIRSLQQELRTLTERKIGERFGLTASGLRSHLYRMGISLRQIGGETR